MRKDMETNLDIKKKIQDLQNDVVENRKKQQDVLIDKINCLKNVSSETIVKRVPPVIPGGDPSFDFIPILSDKNRNTVENKIMELIKKL